MRYWLVYEGQDDQWKCVELQKRYGTRDVEKEARRLVTCGHEVYGGIKINECRLYTARLPMLNDWRVSYFGFQSPYVDITKIALERNAQIAASDIG